MSEHPEKSLATEPYTTPAGFTLEPNDNCLTILLRKCEEVPNAPFLSRPEGHTWTDVSGKELAEMIRAVAKGLVANGIEPGDRVVLMAESSWEWMVLDFAIWAAGAASVPIYPSSSASQVQWIVEDSGAKLAITDDEANRGLFNNLVLGPDGTAPLHDSPTQLARTFSFANDAVDTLIGDGKDVDDAIIDERTAAIRLDDLASIVYTSGTTGKPKGCIHTHRVWTSQATALLTNPIGTAIADRESPSYVTILPMAHVLARSVHLAASMAAGHQAHWADTSTIPMGLQKFKPNLLLAVPRVFEKVRDGAYNKAADSSDISARIFLEAEKAAIAYSEALDTDKGPGFALKARRAVFDKLVFKKLREAVGNEVQYAISGGSAISVNLLHFFRGAGIPIYEGYGLTETAAAAAVNNPDNIKIGTVGRPNNGYSVKISDDGEICFKGDGVFTGYWNNQEATDEAIIDGWFHTGDLGTVDEEGYITITGRKKDIIVTAGGKNISPGPMEDLLRGDSLISQAVVVGEDRPFVGVLITLDEDELARWKKSHGIPKDMSVHDLIRRSPELRAEIQDAVNEANRSVSHAEQIKKFRVLDHDLTEESGEMTATMKIKRNVVVENYKKDIDRLYRK